MFALFYVHSHGACMVWFALYAQLLHEHSTWTVMSLILFSIKLMFVLYINQNRRPKKREMKRNENKINTQKLKFTQLCTKFVRKIQCFFALALAFRLFVSCMQIACMPYSYTQTLAQKGLFINFDPSDWLCEHVQYVHLQCGWYFYFFALLCGHCMTLKWVVQC